ncbi:MAG TPA: winged helix-turn-helix transcriptional regulator [Luteimonas sp.]|nr:winged helix-turn-helix transcriptional regulator [Luteimonas sp.]
MESKKITSTQSDPPARRWYDDACGTAHALELVGERWSLLILRELMFGPRRFGDIRTSLPGLSANVLSQRLETLEGHGLVVRSRLPPPAAVQVYGLTAWGYEADALLMVLGRWAARSPDHDPRLPLSESSLMLSLRTMFRAGAAGGVAMTVGFVFGDQSFHVRIAGQALTAARGDVAGADVVFRATPEAMAAFVYGKRPLQALETDGAITLAGDRAAALRFQDLFELPDKASVATPTAPAAT